MAIHLRFPGFGDDGPTLEIFECGSIPEHLIVKLITPDFANIAFSVDDVAGIARTVLTAGGA